MSQVALDTEPVEDCYRWQLQLRARLADPLIASTMTAAEQMFFLGAPLAHVVAYEKLLKISRLLRPVRNAARLTRLAVRRAASA
jgi:hypothetical protein